MEARFTKFEDGDNWVNGTVGEYKFQAKLFNTGSSFGIDDGRVSKLCIWDEDGSIVDYDRSWGIKPSTPKEITYFKSVMKLLENSPQRKFK